MHSSAELADTSFALTIAGRDGLWVDDLLPGFDERDRLGVVVRHPLGALGASTAILAAVTAFYDVQRAHGGEFFIYPDYFLFHVGRRLGDHTAGSSSTPPWRCSEPMSSGRLAGLRFEGTRSRRDAKCRTS